MSEPMTTVQQEKLDLIGKILDVAQEDTADAKIVAAEWDAKLGFIRRTAEVLKADAAAKEETERALAAIAEDVRAGKL